ncbi:MAG: HAD family hydrolase [Candidatus Sericytochromatia bacterium]
MAEAVPANLNWSPENQQKIDRFFFGGNLQGQVAVFDADDTLWRHDAGEAFLKFLLERNKLVNVPAGFDVFANYEALCAQNKWLGYPYASQVMAGMKVADIKALAKEFFTGPFQANIYPGQRSLIQRLQRAGVEVWIVSASPQWLIEQGAPYLGVPADHVVGVRLGEANGLATPHVIPPMTFRQGKVEAITKYIGKTPVLVAGDSITDFEMLKIASRLQLVINPKDKNAPEDNIFYQATQRGWPIQRW